MTLAVFPCTLLEAGTLSNVVNGVAATQSAPSGTGLLATNPMFTVAGRGGYGTNDVTFHADGVGGIPTTATGALYASDNGGVSWNLFSSGINLVATGAGSDQTVTGLKPGLIYQLILSAVTLGGSATAVNVSAAVA